MELYKYIYNISDMRDIFEIVYCCRIVLHITYILFVCFFDDLNWKQGVFWELHLHLHLLKCFLGNMSESNASVLLLRARTEIYVKHWRYVFQTFTSFIITEKTLQLHRWDRWASLCFGMGTFWEETSFWMVQGVSH